MVENKITLPTGNDTPQPKPRYGTLRTGAPEIYNGDKWVLLSSEEGEHIMEDLYKIPPVSKIGTIRYPKSIDDSRLSLALGTPEIFDGKEWHSLGSEAGKAALKEAQEK